MTYDTGLGEKNSKICNYLHVIKLLHLTKDYKISQTLEIFGKDDCDLKTYW
jgi:hypothetical protein